MSDDTLRVATWNVDLHAQPGNPAVEAVGERYVDVWSAAGSDEGLTMPAGQPTARIDYLFASPEARPTRALTPTT